MPRTICQNCGRRKIVYRIYIDRDKKPKKRSKFENVGTTKEICKPCAIKFLTDDNVFNLRKIYRENLGTSKPEDWNSYEY